MLFRWLSLKEEFDMVFVKLEAMMMSYMLISGRSVYILKSIAQQELDTI